MDIPKSFQLMGQTINVLFDDNHCHLRDCVGIADWQGNTITLARHGKDGDVISEKIIEQTLLHEILHLIHDALGIIFFTEITVDERYIIQISGLFHQAISSFKS